MKLSDYTFCVSDHPHSGEHLLFNTRTQAMVKINKELREVIEDYYDPQKFILKEKYCDELIKLYEMGIIVENEEQDRQKIESFFHQLKTTVKKSCLQVTILTTDACNFNCVYCFEKDAQENVNMEISTCDLTMNWIEKQIEKFGYEELSVTFYGGEPLVNKSSLEYMASNLNDRCNARGVGFKFMLQTNGYLMTPDIIDKYLKLGLYKALISVDGVGSIHDKNRPLRSGGGTFDTVIKNVSDCVAKVKIGISTSYEKDDIGHIEDMLNYFDEIGILHKIKDFIFAPIHPSLGPKDNPESFRQMSCMCNYDDDVIISANEKVRELMERKGLLAKGMLAMAACSLTRENAGVTIDQRGRIFKCNSMLGYPEFAVGDVREDTFNEKHREFLGLDAWRKCPQDCTYLPMCSGGCRFMSFLENKNFTMPVCKKKYLDKVTPEYIRREYDVMAGNPK